MPAVKYQPILSTAKQTSSATRPDELLEIWRRDCFRAKPEAEFQNLRVENNRIYNITKP